ncbi:MAG: hypothetical protein HS126_16450 [Anaerolineales bacterium]|nr:hypothetical protein [Anaerolineales bacterium]
MSKTRRRTAVTRKSSASTPISPLMIGLVAGAAILIVGGLIALGFMGNQVTANVDLSVFPSKGPATAPVTMVEYSDYG